jgi:hypothetical protein
MMNRHKEYVFIASIIVLFLMAFTSFDQLGAANQVKKDNSGFRKIVEDYANAMIKQGRDHYGKEHSPLFASALNRETMKLGTKVEFGSIEGVRETDRALGGANPLSDKDLLRILYELTDLTGDKKYAKEADDALGFFFSHCQSPATGLMCWGEHLYWDFYSEACAHAPNFDIHETEVWPFWDQCYKLAPDACWKFAIGEWDHQIFDKMTGDFSRHAKWSEHGPKSGFEFPRYAGQMIERWADAYTRKENFNRERREELLTAIEVLFRRMEENTKLTKSGYLPAGRSNEGDHINVVWLTSNLELARCLEKAAHLMDKELSARMKKFAFQQDINFLNAPHKFDSIGGGFAVTLHAETGRPRTRSMNKPYSTEWGSGYGYGPHAGTANLCYQRYSRLYAEYPELAQKYRALMLVAANKYLESSPDTSQLLKPDVFSDVIELMLNSYETTGDEVYLDRANYFGQLGVKIFLPDGSPLPRATNKHSHYEAMTGGPDFMYELLKIHLVTMTEAK